jgi:hypothetical protein
MTEIETPTRYDGLLAAMPASVAGGTAAGLWLTIPLRIGIGVGGVVAGFLVLVSLFHMSPQ